MGQIDKKGSTSKKNFWISRLTFSEKKEKLNFTNQSVTWQPSPSICRMVFHKVIESCAPCKGE